MTAVPPELGPNRARAWLITVINPVLEGLARAKYYLESQHWTWRFRTGWFEVVYPPGALVPVPYQPNLEDLVARIDTVREAFREYEEALDELARCCTAAHEHLMGEPAFPTRVEKLDEAYALDEDVRAKNRWGREWWGALPRDEAPKLVAERIVNRAPGDPYASDARFWSLFGDDLLALMTDEVHRAVFSAMDDAGARASCARDKAEAALCDLRRELGAVHDLPPVPA